MSTDSPVAISYSKTDCDGVVVVNAHAVAPHFGLWCRFELTTYKIDNDTAITFSFGLAESEACPNNPFLALQDGVLRISDGRDTAYRVIEQRVTVKPTYGLVMSMSDIRAGGVEAGRMVANNLLRKYELLIETTRQYVRHSLGRELRGRMIAVLQQRFGAATRRTIHELLGRFNWPLLLEASGCGQQCLDVIEYTLTHNPPAYREFNCTDELEDVAMHNEASPLIHAAVAGRRAFALFRRICGETLAEEYLQHGRITVESRGYRFVISPMRWVECTDRNGYTGQLCIHTIGLCCHPIDELILAYLNIKYRLSDYLRTAIVHRSQSGFKLSAEADTSAVVHHV